MKIKVFIIISLFFPSMVLASGNDISEEFQTDIYKAKVIDVISEEIYEENIVQNVEIKILNGEHNNNTYVIKNTIIDSTSEYKLSAGDKINVVSNLSAEDLTFYFYSFEKSNALILLVTLFFLSILVLGRKKGLKALISLVITIILIIFGLVPLLLKGYNPILLSIIICILSTVITFVITNGFTKKTSVAILGVIGGLLIAGLIATAFSQLSNLTGLASESEQMLNYLPYDFTFDFKGLLFAGIIIGALGACMDVAMELTSSLIEIKSHTPNIQINKLVKSGFNIGKDIMGTMVNTLILAYTGSSLPMIMLFLGLEKNMYEIINLESIATEIIRALSGSIGLLCTIPITIGIFVLIYREDKNEKGWI